MSTLIRYTVWVPQEKAEEFLDLCRTDLIEDYDFEDTWDTEG